MSSHFTAVGKDAAGGNFFTAASLLGTLSGTKMTKNLSSLWTSLSKLNLMKDNQEFTQTVTMIFISFQPSAMPRNLTAIDNF